MHTSILVKSVVAVASTAVIIPYSLALYCNLRYGWPMWRKDKYRRALNPKKVYNVTYAAIKSLGVIRLLPLAIRWTWFYACAGPAKLIKNITYGHNENNLDVYLPSEDSEEPHPVVIFVHGGAWSSGNKKMYSLLCAQLVETLNAVVLCPNYSIYPKGYVNDMLQDVVDCIAWAQNNVGQFRGDKTNIMLIGHSSGAHLCVMSVCELLHSCQAELVPSPSRQLSTVSSDSIRFEEQYFDGSNGENGEDDGEVNKLTDSSGSFMIINDNNESGPQSLRDMVLSSVSDGGGDGPQDVGGDRPQQGNEETEGSEKYETPREVLETNEETTVFADTDKSFQRRWQLQMPSAAAGILKPIKAVIGLAGVYHIADHYKFESWRGVEDISYMGRLMYGPNHFDQFSPVVAVRNLPSSVGIPPVVLIHGTQDTIVPVSSSTQFAEVLSALPGTDVMLHYIPGCGHVDVCFDLMSPGRKHYNEVMGIIIATAKRVMPNEA